MNRKLQVACAAALTLGFSSAAMAQGPSWDYVSVSWIVGGDYKEDSFTEGLDGFRISAAKSLDKTFFVNIDATNTDVEDIGIRLDFSRQQFGLGGRLAATPGTDLWASLNYDRATYVGLVGYGFGLELGVRSQVTNAMELGFTYKHSPNLDFDLLGDAELTGYELGLAFNATPKTALTLTYGSHKLKDDFGDEVKWDGVVGLGIRMAF